MQLSLTLGATNLDLTLEFYRRIPGLKPLWLTDSRGSRIALLIRVNEFRILFQSIQTMEQQHPALLQHLSRTTLGAGVVLEFECPDLDAVYLTARRHSRPILYELDDQEHQRREIWLQDPNEYLLASNKESRSPA